MRIVGGELAGRTIGAPRGEETRPTSDRVREAIFNRLAHGALAPASPFAAPVLDLFAGAGGLGLEALSRGAPRCDFVDDNAAACACIRANLEALGLAERAHVAQARADAFLRRASPGQGGYGLVFVDPPYAAAGAPLDRVLAALGPHLVAGALVIVEHGAKLAPAATRGGEAGLRLIDQRRYGQTVVSSFVAPGESPFESSGTGERDKGRSQ
jgi:16S rRNA (guanine966-N2)-methyltransferase